MLVRDGKLKVDPELMDAVFAGMDRLRAMLDDIQASDRIPCARRWPGSGRSWRARAWSQGAQVKARGKDSRAASGSSTWTWKA